MSEARSDANEENKDMEHLGTQLVDHLLSHGFSMVREAIVQKRPDWTGAESMFIWILMDDKVTSKELNWDALQPIDMVAARWMQTIEPELFPYVSFRRVREWAEVANS